MYATWLNQIEVQLLHWKFNGYAEPMAQRPIAALQTPIGRLEDIADDAVGDDVAGDAACIAREIGGDPNALPILARLQIRGPHGNTGQARKQRTDLPTPEPLGYAHPD